MHPIERLRYVARASGAPASVLARESAGALMSFADEPAALVTACRRLVERHPTAGPIAWLAARALTAREPRRELHDALDELDDDQTGKALAFELPDDARVTVVGQSRLVAEALFARGDVLAHVVDVLGEGRDLAWELSEAGNDAIEVRTEGMATAITESDIVIIEASAWGPTQAMTVIGSHSAAAIAKASGAEVWMAAGVGTVLPEKMFQGLAARCEQREDPWDRDDEIVPIDLVDAVVCRAGKKSVREALALTDCPIAPELFPAG